MTALYELLRDRLGQDPIEWVNALRAEDAKLSWASIARLLHARTDRWVSGETLRVWVKDATDSPPDKDRTG